MYVAYKGTLKMLQEVRVIIQSEFFTDFNPPFNFYIIDFFSTMKL